MKNLKNTTNGVEQFGDSHPEGSDTSKAECVEKFNPDQPLFLHGRGLKQTSGFDYVSFNQITNTKPTVGPKLEAAFFAPHDGLDKTKEGALAGAFSMLIIDHDTGDLSKEKIKSIYKDVCFHAFTTSNHQQKDESHLIAQNRWKVLIPLLHSIDFVEFSKLSIGTQLRLGADPSQARASQVCFMPNILFKGAPFETVSNIAEVLDPCDRHHPFVQSALDAYQQDGSRKRALAEKAPSKKCPATKSGIIGLVNDAFDIRAVLTQFGYQPIGDRFLAPKSSSGIPGVVIFDDSQKCYSHHSKDSDPLADGYYHDLFDVIVHYEFGGDVGRAVAHFANELDPEGQKHRQKAFRENQDWPELLPFGEAVPANLPVELWPEKLSDFVQGLAAQTETPTDLAAVLVLGALATAVQQPFLIQLDKKSKYIEPLCIYALAALPPATRKSAVFKKVTKPFIAWESQKRKELGAEVKEIEVKVRRLNKKLTKLEKDLANAADAQKEMDLEKQISELEAKIPVVPTLPRVWASDVTTEKLALLMEDNAETCGVMSSEGGIFETMAGRYNQGVPNIDLYLQAHAGDPVRVDRKNGAQVILDNPRLSMVLAVQPDVLQAMKSKPGFKGRGLLGRFLYVVPNSNLGSRTGNTVEISQFVEADYAVLLGDLLDFAYMQRGEDGSIINLSDSAFSEWKSFWHEVEQDLAEGGRFEYCRDWGGKLPGAVGRIAGLFHVARHKESSGNTALCVEDMTAAVETGKALADHALLAFDLMAVDPDVSASQRVLRWIKRKQLNEFTRRKVCQDHKSLFTKIGDEAGALEILAERGYIRKKQANHPRSTLYEVNPLVLAGD